LPQPETRATVSSEVTERRRSFMGVLQTSPAAHGVGNQDPGQNHVMGDQ
jgi:hypothetical protein